VKLLFKILPLLLLCFACKKKAVETGVTAIVWNYYANRGEPNVKVALKERNNNYGSSGSSSINNSETVLQDGYTDSEGNCYFENFSARVNRKSKENYEYVLSITELFGKTITQSAIGGEAVEKGQFLNVRIPIYVNGTLNFSITNNPPKGGSDTIQVMFINPYDLIGTIRGFTYQTSYGSSIYPSLRPMGPYNVTIKKFKAGIYTETSESIYINGNQTTSYTIVF